MPRRRKPGTGGSRRKALPGGGGVPAPGGTIDRYFLLFDMAPVPYALVDGKGKILEANLALCSLVERTRSYLTGLPMVMLVAEADRAFYLDHMRRCRASEGEAVSGHLGLRSGSSRRIDVQLLTRPQPTDGVRRAFLSAVLDRTERNEVEAALRSSREAADEAARQLRAMAAEMNRAEQNERRRIAAILHDHLQQLMVSAKIKLGIAGRSGPAPLVRSLDEVREILDEAIQASRSLAVELSPPVLHDAGLPAGLAWLARWMREKHSLSVSVDAGRETDTRDQEARTFLFDSARELLLNIVKHSGVRKAGVALAREDRRLSLSVSDGGQGFDPAALRRAQPGEHSGLLTIEQRARLMGGSVAVTSAPGQGARITVEVSEHPQPGPEERLVPRAGSAGRDGARAAAGRSTRVLIVDDHRLFREGLIAFLREEPAVEVVGEAGSGEEALKQAEALRPDVVLMDVTMPGWSGMQTTRRLRGALPDVRIVGLSMHPPEDMGPAMLDAGADIYLSKGGHPEDLVRAIRGDDGAAVDRDGSAASSGGRD
ncbi:MAG TPA: response regulator [Candidatus Polarisedimenticolia bacterium]|nr:response regulator [Candidatus Polarisedimenticolia bacterium]